MSFNKEEPNNFVSLNARPPRSQNSLKQTDIQSDKKTKDEQKNRCKEDHAN